MPWQSQAPKSQGEVDVNTMKDCSPTHIVTVF